MTDELETKARRIAEIIDRNLYRQDEKVEDAKALAIELADELSRIRAETAKNSGEAIEAAYREGYEDGEVGKFNTEDAWHVSETRAALSSLCQTCDGRGEVGGYQRFGDGDVDCVIEPCPVCATPANSRAEAIGAREADSPLLAASYYAMSKAMELLDADLGHGTVLNMLAKCRVDIENRRALLDTQQPVSRTEAIGVKPLEWENLGGGVYKAPSPLFGSIRIEPCGSEYCVTWSVPGMCDTFTKGFFGTPDDAKAAAQADYNQRIRSALLQQEGE